MTVWATDSDGPTDVDRQTRVSNRLMRPNNRLVAREGNWIVRPERRCQTDGTPTPTEGDSEDYRLTDDDRPTALDRRTYSSDDGRERP